MDNSAKFTSDLTTFIKIFNVRLYNLKDFKFDNDKDYEQLPITSIHNGDPFIDNVTLLLIFKDPATK